MKYVIIGTGGAGVSAAEAIRSVDKDSELTMISSEDTPPYSPCLLLYYVEDKAMKDHLYWKGKDFYEKLSVNTVLGSQVNRIDTSRKRVTLDSGEEIRYDKLLIASGGKVTYPPIKGLDLNGVFTFKTLSDADNIHKWLEENDVVNGVVIGGGFIGLDAGEALQKRGVNITIIELLDRLLPRMLDKEMGNIVEDIFEEHGVKVLLKSKVSEIIGEESMGRKVKGVKLADGRILPADIVIIATGVRPNLDFAEKSGIKTNRGILVDEFLETSSKDVFAAGDVAESLNVVTGKEEPILLWPNALLEGAIAGYNMLGYKLRYYGSDNQTIIKVYGVPVVSEGVQEGDAIKYFDAKNKVYKKMYIENSYIKGYILINTMKNAGLYHSLIRKKEDIQRFKDIILTDRFNIGTFLKDSLLQQYTSQYLNHMDKMYMSKGCLV
ncbi:MAG: FAD-dependent oxidoreductase [Desulfurococcales archaeon]|nr:FAD-dependent oxidoreductase [Desulfurococcales archaeon]